MKRRKGKTFAPGGPGRKKKVTRKKSPTPRRKAVVRKKVGRARKRKVSGEVADLDSLQGQVNTILEKTTSVGNVILDEVYDEVGKVRNKLTKRFGDFLTEVEAALDAVQDDLGSRYWAAAKKAEKEDDKS